MAPFLRTTATHRPGAETLPREHYTSWDVFTEEMERIFARGWNCVGRASALEEPGDYILAEVAGDSLIIVKGDDGATRALFNVCRHRGTRLCTEEAGRFGAAIRCPYHGWAYAWDGRLVGAPHIQEDPEFRPERFGLAAAAVVEWEGFLFVNIAEDPEPFETAWAPLAGRFDRFGLAGLTSVHAVEYEVKANWKLVFENYAECLHCPTIHPELSFILPYQSGQNDLTEGPFLGGYLEIREPHQSATKSGRRAAPYIAPDLPAEDRRRAYYYSLMPNLLLSIHPDYVNYYLIRPVAVNRTLVLSEWLFRPDESDDTPFQPEEAIEFWETTNRQDWDIVERGQAGVVSRRYTPGPYSARESIPAAWDREYLRQIGRG